MSIVVRNDTNSVFITGTMRCGTTSKSVTSSGASQHNSGGTEWVVKRPWTYDDASHPPNCFTDHVPGATVTVTCSAIRNPEAAAGAGTAVGTVTYSPGLTLAGGSTLFSLSSTVAETTVVDPLSTLAFTGPISIVATGSSDTTEFLESCAIGEGDLSLGFSGSGIGTITGSGTGRYRRVGTVLQLVVAVDNLTINGQQAGNSSFALDGPIVPNGVCGSGSVTTGTFVGTATVD